MTRMLPVVVVVVVVVVGVAFGRSVAIAQPATGGASAEADSLFEHGRQLMESGKLAEACDAFDASQKLSPALTTMFNQANCRELNGQLATAWGLFQEAERQTRSATDDASKALRQVATDRAAALKPRLSTLTITVDANARVEGLTIMRDKVLLESGAWNNPLPIDGGSHTISVTAPGHVEWTTPFTIAVERDAKTISIPALEKLPEQVVQSDSDDHDDTAPTAHRSKTVPLALGAGGVVLLGGALALDLAARSQYADAEAEVDDARQESLWKSAKTKRYIAQGVAVAGIGCVAAGVWLYLRHPDEKSEVARTRAVTVQPVVASESFGIQLFGRY